MKMIAISILPPVCLLLQFRSDWMVEEEESIKLFL